MSLFAAQKVVSFPCKCQSLLFFTLAKMWLCFDCLFFCVIHHIVAFSGPACGVVHIATIDCGPCAGGCNVVDNVCHNFRMATITKCHVNTVIAILQ